MNYYRLSIILSMLLINSYGISCPTCVGKLKKDGPVFFAEDFYKPVEQTEKKDAHKKK